MNAQFDPAASQANGYGNHRRWDARINLAFANRQNKTILEDMAFVGPLRVQRPFYPEGNVCHVYLLHPPGGMVSGDQLNIDIKVGESAHALLTTPSAGKIYAADSCQIPQKQRVTIAVQSGCLEWLPQENIIFDGAHAHLETRAELNRDASLVAWDMVGFGRPEGEHWFKSGSLSQNWTIYRENKPVLIERFRLDPELALLKSKAGLMGMHFQATMYLCCPDANALIEKVRALLPAPSEALMSACTCRDGVLSVRCLGEDAQTTRNLLATIWAAIRQDAIRKPACVPRIWST